MTRGNPLFDRCNPKDKGAHGRKAEKKTAKRLGGRQQPGSGALDDAKGDITYRRWLVENKAVNSGVESITIPLQWLLKVYSEARASDLSPALAFQFTTSEGLSDARARWVCIPESTFLDLTGG